MSDINDVGSRGMTALFQCPDLVLICQPVDQYQESLPSAEVALYAPYMPTFSADDPLSLRLEFESVPTGSPASEVARQLVTLLTAGELAPGSRLPSERILSDKLGVGRSAVREALAALEILGIVQIRPGSGTYLRGGTSDLLPTTLSWGLMLAAERTPELLEVRSSLERTAAGLAAARATDAELATLAGYLDRQSANFDDAEAFIDADLRFHVQIARIAGNEVLSDLLQSLRSLLRVWVERGVRPGESITAAYEEHRRVYEALCTRDVAAAEGAMQVHMDTANARLLAIDVDSAAAS